MNIVELLIDNKADANVIDKYGKTVLHYALQGGGASLEVVQLLLMHYTLDINATSRYGELPLYT